MLVPPVGSIEAGADSLKTTPAWVAADQFKELEQLGNDSLAKAGVTIITPDFEKGYALGLATARVIIAGSVAAMEGGAPNKIL